jgi:predicted Zn-dependent protease
VPEARRAVVTPDRLRVKPAPAGGTLQSLLARLGPTPLSADDVALINGVALDDRISTGQWLKIVEPGRR